MTVFEIVKLNCSLLESLTKLGISPDDHKYVPVFADYVRLREDNLKVEYIVAYLKDKYGVAERTIYRMVKRFNSEVKL